VSWPGSLIPSPRNLTSPPLRRWSPLG